MNKFKMLMDSANWWFKKIERYCGTVVKINVESQQKRTPQNHYPKFNQLKIALVHL